METYGASTDSTFPEADVDKALNSALNKKFEVDPVSSDISTTKEIQQGSSNHELMYTKGGLYKNVHKEQDEAAQKKQREKQDALQNLKTTIFVSAIIVAVAGAVFAITKKLREK
ncbi:uncharacterized protein LOC7465266 isoform X1 [Populus trichocarpa]|uniref:uncharacterized protein LOC7465266 isoform X1 n=1 Tax=Populus trichocarpa TaxID=3694 RepID=UPI002278F75D|nr:uncharacterized protein LOC7465266 isoform X1 [Populus trichocarpa]